jgi:hypothetical protein
MVSKECCQFVDMVIKRGMVLKSFHMDLRKTPCLGEAAPVVVAAATTLFLPPV